MDNVTHTLFGLTLARTPLGRKPGATTALVLASNAPDIDIVATAGGAMKYLEWHRGPTHGLIGIAGLGLATAALVWTGSRAIGKTRAPFLELAAVSMLGVLLHILMDVPTSYGTRVLSPFDWHWFAADWMPIVDIYLLIILGACLLFGRGSPAARRRNVSIALMLMATDYGVRAVAHHEALSQAARLFGPTLPAPCQSGRPDRSPVDWWPRVESSVANSAPERCLVEVAAQPTFLSPFVWRVIAETSDAYEVHDVDLLDPRLRDPASAGEAMWRLSVRYPNRWTAPVFSAAKTRLGQLFLGFSRFPAARSFVDGAGYATVRWTDMRFVGGPFGLDQTARRGTPFSATISLDRNGEAVLERFGP